jgi:hypothetical protein
MNERRVQARARRFGEIKTNSESIAAQREGFAILPLLRVLRRQATKGRGVNTSSLVPSSAALASAVWKRVERGDPFDDRLRYPACGIRTGLGDVVADTLKIVGRVRGPADAHQPR